ncbi:MAG: hypothetical protein IT260_24075 [Saprospiraceae bacterium]|nr:hypothetical protein [Saprospiraceae bacterium]
MRNKKWGLLLILALGSILFGSWYFWDPPQGTLTATPSGSETIFTLSNLDPLDARYPNARYKVFLFTGDGHSYMKETVGNNPLNFVHTYSGTAGQYDAYAEFVEIYDDTKDEPPGIAKLTIINPNTGTALPPDISLTNAILNITPVREIVPEHNITFILTYKNPECTDAGSIAGNLKFYYDTGILEPDNINGFEAQYDGVVDYVDPTWISAWQNNNPTSPVNINLATMAPGTQRNIFLRFKTKQGVAVSDAINQVPKVEFALSSNDQKICNSFATVFELSTMNTVKNGHDPNQKTLDLIVDNGQQYFEHTIFFQNDGHTEVNKILITDELDAQLNCISSITPNDITCFPPAVIPPSHITFNNHTLQVQLTDMKLPGLKQQGFGSDFYEKDTKGWLKFRTPATPGCPTIPPCGALLNRASIQFECNPPLETVLAEWHNTCFEFGSPPLPATSSVPASTLINIQCSTDTIVVDTSVTAPFLPGNIDLSDYTPEECHWYPTTGLDLTNPKNPEYTETPQKNRTYTLVASKACQRLIVHRIIRVPCDLKLQEPVITTNADRSYSISCGVEGNATGAIWQDCSNVQTQFTFDTVGPGTYYFSVYNPLTGCSDEKWVSTMKATDEPSDCTANLSVTGGNGPYTYLWQYTDSDGHVQYSTQASSLDLSDKSRISVTVTDSDGNTTTFFPSKNCPLLPWWGWGLIGLGVVLVLTLLRGGRRWFGGVKGP